MRRLGIAGRVFLYTAAIVCTVLVAAFAVASSSGRRAAMEEERRDLEQAADLTAQLMAARTRLLLGGARVFVQPAPFHTMVREGSSRRTDILDQAIEVEEQLGASWVFITDDRGTLLGKSDETEAPAVSLAGIPLVSRALEGGATTGFGVSRDTMLFYAVAVPIAPPRAAPVGVLVATRVVDDSVAKDVSATTGTEVIFYTLDETGAPRVAATSLSSRAHAAAALPAARGARATETRSVRFGERWYALQSAGLASAGGEVRGGYVVARLREGTPREIIGVRRSLLVAGALGLLLALAASWSAARHLTRPARALAAAAERARDGAYDQAVRDATAATAGAPRDEIADLGEALATLLAELREKQALVAMLGGAVASEDESTSTDEPAHVERPIIGPRRSRPGQRVSAATRALATPWSARQGGTLSTGAVIADRYVVQSTLGAGGTGVVYKAIDKTLGEPVAIKMLRTELVDDDPETTEELKHELRLTRRVSHRNVVRTHDFGSHRGVPFITMEFVDGASLASVLSHRGALPPDVVLSLARQLVRALEAAHEQDVMHGDLKPANLIVARDGTLKVADFGIATLVRRPRGTIEAPEVVRPPRLAGAVIGTPEYMAPEQLLGGAPDVRTDLYAAGMVLHESLTGATPFPRDTPRAFLSRKLDSPVERPAFRPDAGAPQTLEGVITWMAATDPTERPSSAAVVGMALSRLSMRTSPGRE